MNNGLSALAGWLALMTVALGCDAPAMARSSPAICGPFGNPPAIFIAVVKPDCLHGTLLGPWKDPDGNDRYACLWEPYPATSKRRLAMVIYLHPSLFEPKNVAQTGLLLHQDSTALGAGGNGAGYVVLAPAGRDTLHHYPHPDKKGIGWDNWYRQLNPAGSTTAHKGLYRENVDAATIDHFAAEELRNRQGRHRPGLHHGMVQRRCDGAFVRAQPAQYRGSRRLLGAESVWRLQRSLPADAGQGARRE